VTAKPKAPKGTVAAPRPRPGEGPEGAIAALSEALGRADADAATACFVPGGCLLTPDGTSVSGADGIREVLAALAASFTRVEANAGRMVITGQTALCTQRWLLASAVAGVEEFEHTLDATLVLRQDSGGWRVLIAAPWGI
jgi:ketosteroid isomerase-like protein